MILRSYIYATTLSNNFAQLVQPKYDIAKFFVCKTCSGLNFGKSYTIFESLDDFQRRVRRSHGRLAG